MSLPDGAVVVLLRHGRTAWNLEHRFQGQHDTELDDTGREQALAAAGAVADALTGRRVRVVTSDLRRASGTAEAVAAATGTAAVLDARLREIGAGSWQGLLQAEIEALDPERYAAWRGGEDVRLGEGERPTEAGERVRAAVTEHAARLDEDDCLVAVGHGASIRAGLAALLGQPGLGRVLVPLANTGTAVLSGAVRGTGTMRLHGWNVPPTALGQVLGRGSSASAALT